MRKLNLIALIAGPVLVGSVASPARADPPSIPTPATATATAKPAPRVQVFAFASLGNAGTGDWIGRGIQESLQGEVSRTGAALVMAPQAGPATTSPAPADPVATAKVNNATLAVVGSYQTVGDQVRVNGHVVDTATGTTVGGFSATAQAQDLFKLEDALGEQMRRLLPVPGLSPQADPSFQPSGSPNGVASAYEVPAAPTTVYVQPTYTAVEPPAVNNYYTTASAPYYYPENYGYIDPYPFGIYGGIGFYSGFGYGGYGGYNHYRSGTGYHNGGAGIGGRSYLGRPSQSGQSFGGRGGFGGSFGAGGGFHGGGGGHR